MTQFKRILLKLSGESLQGNVGYGIDSQILNQYADEIATVGKMGVEIGIVIGGGNIFRGLKGTKAGFDRVKGDYMGMLATVINSIALQSALEVAGCKARVYTAVKMEPMAEYYAKGKVLEAMRDGYICILAGGTGNPYFTTDTASALRAVETESEVLLKGTRVDGVYNVDPEKNKNAVKFDELTFDMAYQQQLQIMDLTAFTLCKENNLPVIVFDMNKKGNLEQLILGKKIGTLVRK